MPMGGLGWRLGVVFDHFAVSGFRRVLPFRVPPVAPADGLTGTVLYYASGGHSRDVGPLFVTPALDVPAALLSDGRAAVFWYETLSSDHPSLVRTLHGPAYGLEGLLVDARRRAMRLGTAHALRRLPGFSEFCRAAAKRLGLGERFLLLWLARQVNLSISVSNAFGKVFNQYGRPDLLLLLNSCVWSTTGLVAAAKRIEIPVIEVHHGAESESAVTAPGQQPHFSQFNTAPDALISWECEDRKDDLVFSSGPLGLRLGEIVPDRQPLERRSYAQLRQLISEQKRALARRVSDVSFAAELVVSLQPGDSGEWIFAILQELSTSVFTWIRVHAGDRGGAAPKIPPSFSRTTDCDLSGSTLLALLLDRADVHLTRFSGVTLEAAALGVPTVATDNYAANLYGRHVPKGALFIGTSTRAVAEQIELILASPRVKRAERLPSLADLAPFVRRVASDASRAPKA